jgi:hypothetical protein
MVERSRRTERGEVPSAAREGRSAGLACDGETGIPGGKERGSANSNADPKTVPRWQAIAEEQVQVDSVGVSVKSMMSSEKEP